MKDIQVITGCMFAGKTTELISRLKKTKKKYLLVKPKLDNRDSGNQVCTHSGFSEKAQRVDRLLDIFEQLADIQVVGIDEAQFFSDSIIQDIKYLSLNNIKIIVAGLEKDYLDKPFGPMDSIIQMATSVIRLKASCTRCSAPATHSYRKVAQIKEQLLIGSEKIYEALCTQCFQKTHKK